MELTKDQIKQYSELFHQPESVVKAIATMYDTDAEIQENLYLLGEEHLPEDDENDEVDDENEDYENNEVFEIESKLKEIIANEMGVSPEEIDATIKPIKVNKDVFNHHCPFTDEQKENFSCDFCPLNLLNFVKLSFRIATDEQIRVEEAAEYIKFMTYRFYNETYEKIILDMKKSKKNDTNC